MTSFVTITSQGQISIPIHIRRMLGLERFRQAVIDVEDNKIIVEPVADILDFEGVLKLKAKKGKPIGQIIEEEEKALAKAIMTKYSNK